LRHGWNGGSTPERRQHQCQQRQGAASGHGGDRAHGSGVLDAKRLRIQPRGEWAPQIRGFAQVTGGGRGVKSGSVTRRRP
jgi:hypothetical protein